MLINLLNYSSNKCLRVILIKLSMFLMIGDPEWFKHGIADQDTVLVFLEQTINSQE